MNDCKIYCAGSVKAPYDWVTSAPNGIDRIIFINGGEGGYYLDDLKIPFKKGCLYFLPSYIVTYSSYHTDQSRLDHAYVNFELIPPLLSKQVFCLDENSNPEIKSVVDTFKTFCMQCTIKTEYENLTEASQQILKSIVLFLMETIIEKNNWQTIKDEVIINALKLMHEGLDKRQTIADIAKAFYFTPEGFIRKFKKEVGETPYSYLKKLKVRTAQNMRLLGASLDQVAEKCGYADSSSLLHAIGKKTDKGE